MYKHGVYVAEQASTLSTPKTSTAGLVVAVGTAPVNKAQNPAAAVNAPVIAYSYAEAAAQLGFDSDFKAYTLCGVVSAFFQVVGVGPIVCINVLDPAKHTADIPETECQINKGVAKLEVSGAVLDQLVVKAAGQALTAGTDYAAAFNDDGGVDIAVAADGKGKDATTLTVSGKKLDPGKVTKADIVGGVDAAGKETGIEVVRQVYPAFDMVPGILIAPGYSKEPEVAAALQAKTANLNGVFSCICIAEIDSGATGCTQYTKVGAQKEKQAITSKNAYAVWLHKMLGSAFYYGSTAAAAIMVRTDSENNGIPNRSPDNKNDPFGVSCLEDGTEVLLDVEQANAVNAVGAATFAKAGGQKLWGPDSAAAPGTSDPKDQQIGVRRFLIWRANSFILTYFSKVGDPMNRALVDNVVDGENINGNKFKALGICAEDRIEYREEENPVTELAGGYIKFHHICTPFPGTKAIDDLIEFDANAIATALS